MTTVESIKHLFLQTGASWVLWLLGGLSVLSLGITVERWLLFARSAGNLQALADSLHARLSSRDIEGALSALARSTTVPARVARAGLQMAQRGAAAADKAMQGRLALERAALEKRLAYLGTLGNNAPFIGLFGTVIGVIMAFEELGHGAPGHGSGGAGAATQVASAAVMSAIAEALVATAVGIAVALPAVAAYNFLQRRIENLLAGADALSNLVLAYLVTSAEGEAPTSSHDKRSQHGDDRQGGT